MEKLNQGIVYGFLIGAVTGIGISFMIGDFPMWLSIGIGGGLAIGAVAGYTISKRGNQ